MVDLDSSSTRSSMDSSTRLGPLPISRTMGTHPTSSSTRTTWDHPHTRTSDRTGNHKARLRGSNSKGSSLGRGDLKDKGSSNTLDSTRDSNIMGNNNTRASSTRDKGSSNKRKPQDLHRRRLRHPLNQDNLRLRRLRLNQLRNHLSRCSNHNHSRDNRGNKPNRGKSSKSSKDSREDRSKHSSQQQLLLRGLKNLEEIMIDRTETRTSREEEGDQVEHLEEDGSQVEGMPPPLKFLWTTSILMKPTQSLTKRRSSPS